jgi:hypothetical protein
MLKTFPVIARILLSGAVCLALAACSSVAGSGPSAGDVVEEAGTAEAPRYELVDVDSHVVEILRHRGPDSFLAHFGDYRPSVEPRIGIGDTVSVTQVLVNVPRSVSNTVTVTGEVTNGARVPLSVKGDRVMDVIAAAGGIRA